MNIIDINFEKLRKRINDYIFCNNDFCLSVDTVIRYEKPILLMNYDTFKILKKYNNSFCKEEKCFIWTLFGCYICIANWLPTGEVEVR